MPTMHPLTRLYIFSRNLRATPQKADTIEASRSEKINVSLPKTPQNPSENGHATSGEIVDTTFGDDEISIAPTATDATSPPASATAGDAAANAEEHSISAASACLPTILEVPSAPSTPAHPTEARTPSASTPAAAEKDGILESVDPLELGKGGDGTVGTITLQHAADAKTGAADDASVAADGESVELRSEDATAGTEEAKTEVPMISSGDTLQLQHTVRHPATHCNALQCTATHCRWRDDETRRSDDLHDENLTGWRTVTQCNTLQCTATHCNTLQHTAIHCDTLQHTADDARTRSEVMTTHSNVSWLIHINVSWLTHMQCPDALICNRRHATGHAKNKTRVILVHMCNEVRYVYRYHDSCIQQTTFATGMTHSYVSWLIHMCHDSFKRVMTHSYVSSLIYMRHNSFI